jgi:hypothetical protein
MPFDPDNPPAKLKNLSDKKKRQWVHVFNSCWEKHADEKTCHMMAWGTVKKQASTREMAEFLEQNPHVLETLEQSLGVVWDGGKFHALSYPDIPRSEVDRVDNAPGGITAKKKRASLDLEYASPKEVKAIAKMLGGVKLSDHDAAYATYCINALPQSNRNLVDKLGKNALSTYRSALLSWFREALLQRANMVRVTGLNKVLSGFVKDVPKAVLTDGVPDVSKFKADWSFLNPDRLAMAGRKVAKVVKEDSIAAGLWQQVQRQTKQPLVFDRTYKLWVVPYSDWTYENKRMLVNLGFRVDRQQRWWYIRELTPRIKQVFDVGATAPSTSMTAPSLDELNQWYLKQWLPKNINRFKNLFENYIRDAGSTLTFDFSVSGNGVVNAKLTRGVRSLAKAIEELRLRYIGRQGREPWLEVMDYVIKLSKTRGDAAIHVIDRMNNLEHSNGMFMERFPASVKSWYLKFLNAKFSAPRVSDLAKYIRDRDIKELIIYLADEPLLIKQNVDYRYVEKEGPEDTGEDWLAKGYPYAPGAKRPKRDDPEVQKGLEDI